jgi:hypothetical protein
MYSLFRNGRYCLGIRLRMRKLLRNNGEARAALSELTKRDLHPLLREMALGELGIPAERRTARVS